MIDVDDTDACECGDVFDEHEDNGGPCTVDGCGCIAFERAEED